MRKDISSFAACTLWVEQGEKELSLLDLEWRQKRTEREEITMEKFSDILYVRPDMEQAAKEMEEYIKALKGAGSYEEMRKLLEDRPHR